ncbi:hypothetical protein Tco_1217653 [Tanacetum coccineum]
MFDVPLGGFRYTWTDKWALKMIKLDRFLAIEGFHDLFPHITCTVLEKGIPDHGPILLKESVVDYGPTPFCFFHSWLDIEGFHYLVVDTWKTYESSESNGMISFKKKLQSLKQVIRAWDSSKKLSDNQLRKEHQTRLSLIDAKVDQGRNILDGPLILNECMAWYRKRKKALMVFKVDFEKVYDSLRWDYLDVIMENLGFGHKWRTWIYGCLKNSRASILLMFNSKVTQWKAKLLSVGRRLSLIKSVVGGDLDEIKITWVKWNTCLASKATSGFGIRSIYALNASLLFNWIRQFWCSPNDL